MKWLVLKIIHLYQKYISLDTGIVFKKLRTTPVCKFHPTCSEYTRQAIVRYGVIRGAVLGCKRIIRCHPWSEGGIDHVPTKEE